MISKRKFWTFTPRTALRSLAAVLALGGVYHGIPKSLRAGAENPPPFDFSDDFYTQNGIKLDMIQNPQPPGAARVGFAESTRTGTEFGSTPSAFGGQYNWILDSSNTDPIRRGVRVTQTTGAFDSDGNLVYFSSMAGLPDQTFFTEDDAGSRAHDLANRFRQFVFPRQFKNGALWFQTCPLEVQAASSESATCVVLNGGNARQDRVLEIKDEYFCGNLLGLWVTDLVIYTPQIQGPNAQIFLSSLAAKNGTSLDGTPVLKTSAEIEGLVAAGYAQLVEFPDSPHPPVAGTNRYLMCPVIPDPRSGAIAPDAYLVTIKRPDGSEVSPEIRQNFECLQKTGEFCPGWTKVPN